MHTCTLEQIEATCCKPYRDTCHLIYAEVVGAEDKPANLGHIDSAPISVEDKMWLISSALLKGVDCIDFYGQAEEWMAHSLDLPDFVWVHAEICRFDTEIVQQAYDYALNWAFWREAC